MLTNMLAVSAASGLPPKIVFGFMDAEVNRLLDLDSQLRAAARLIINPQLPRKRLAGAPEIWYRQGPRSH